MAAYAILPAGYGAARAAQMDVAANTSGREGLIINQVQGSPPIARFRQNGTTRVLITAPGNLGVGTTTPSQKLHVVGHALVTGYLQADGGVRVKTWSMEVPDYVFDEENYRPMGLGELERFVKANKHLPEIPTRRPMSIPSFSIPSMVEEPSCPGTGLS